MQRKTWVWVTVLLLTGSVAAGGLEVSRAELEPGSTWTTTTRDVSAPLPPLASGWEHRTFWDLRIYAAEGKRTRFRVEEISEEKGESRLVACAEELGSGRSLGCRPLDGGLPETLQNGARYVRSETSIAGTPVAVHGKVVGEGIVLLPAGPRQALLLSESSSANGRDEQHYRFVGENGLTLATVSGPPAMPGDLFRPVHAELLETSAILADDGLEIEFTAFRDALKPKTVGVLQYSISADTALSNVHPGWTSAASALDIDSTSVPYQPDPNDPGSQTTLPEVWDFTALNTVTLDRRTFNTTRDETAGTRCGENCATRDTGAAPPDGTWQSYLKIDQYDNVGTFSTRDVFLLNDNDNGIDPSIDVVSVSQDENNTDDFTQICFEDSAGGAERLLRFFQFTGASPATATIGVGDTWESGDWTECDSSNGLYVRANSVCGDSCYPDCSLVTPYARGRLGNGVGIRTEIIEDGWVHVPAGNFIPALLMRQDTDILAGVDFLGTCNLSPTPNRSFDYFWLQEEYGLLATLSSTNNETITASDWSADGNLTDRADITWGPFPPYQFTARACLSGTRVEWSLPADGSNLNGDPNVSDYGYVVSWGNATDPEDLADWTTNPNHSPLPGDAGYLAAPSGSEPTAYTITGFAGPAIDTTVVTALRYTDPDLADVTSYRSAAFYKVSLPQAELNPATFVVGDSVAPFTARSGGDVALSWPAVAGAAAYQIQVYDLATKSTIACPATLDCNPTSASATHGGAATDSVAYGYRVVAVDACGGLSTN